jgi:hypothetical protein
MCAKDKCCCPSSKAGKKKKVAGKKRRGKVGKARLNASQIISMAPRVSTAVPLYTNNPLGEEQLTGRMPIATPRQMTTQSIATQTEKQIEEIKPIFKRVKALVEVPKSVDLLPPVPATIPGRSRNRVTASMMAPSEEYNTVLGVNVPIKREGQFIKKETGLFEPEARGAPVKANTIAKSYGDIGRFFTRKN